MAVTAVGGTEFWVLILGEGKGEFKVKEGARVESLA